MKNKKIMATILSLVMIISAFVVIFGFGASATDWEVSNDGSGAWDRYLTCGEVITFTVSDNSLVPNDDYDVKVWNGTHWRTLTEVGNDNADEHGDLTIQVHVPGWDELAKCPTLQKGDTSLSAGQWNISLFKDGSQVDATLNTTITIGNLYDIRYKHNGVWLDHIVYNMTYGQLYIYVYNWTSSGWEVEDDETFDFWLYQPDGTQIDTKQDSTVGYWDADLSRSQNNYNNGNGCLENNLKVTVKNDNNALHLSNAKLPTKINMTINAPSSATWGDTINVEGNIYDGQSDYVPNYDVAIYCPMNGGYYQVDTDDTSSLGRYSFSINTGTGYTPYAGTWYVGTYETTSGTHRINETEILNIPDFISYGSFEVGTKSSATVRVENSADLITGFNQTVNVSVRNMSWMENDEYRSMKIHVTGLDAWNGTSAVEYADDDIVLVNDGTCHFYNDNKAYYRFTYRFNQTGSGTILVSWPGNMTDQGKNDSYYSDTYSNEELLPSISGSTTFSVVSPSNINMIVRGTMMDSVVVTETTSTKWINGSDTFTIDVYGSTQDERKNATITVSGCGLDFTIEEDDTASTNDHLVSKGNGQYTVRISPKTAGTLTITATNGSDSDSNDYTITGLYGSVTTSIGDDLEISVETLETITATITNGQYAQLRVTYYTRTWGGATSVNYTTGDNTAGNGLNGVFEIKPELTDLDVVGYLVVAAKAGSSLYMYDIIEIAPVHDLDVQVVNPAAEENQTLTVGLDDQTLEVEIKDPDGDIVDDIDTVTGKLIDEDHDEDDPLQTVTFTHTGDRWVLPSSFVPRFDGQLLITAVNNSGVNEHDGNVTVDVEHATMTFSPGAAIAAIGTRNLTVTITTQDALGNPLPEGTTLYINVHDAKSTIDDTTVQVENDGTAEFEIINVKDDIGTINVTLQGFYSASYRGNLTLGEFTIKFPNFDVEPSTIYIGRPNTVKVTATDDDGNPLDLNLTLLPTSQTSWGMAWVPDPVRTNAAGEAIFSVSPDASGTLNVTIMKNITYTNGALDIEAEDYVMTSTVVTITSLKELEISVSKSPINQGDTLVVTIKSGDVGVDGISVTFGEASQTTKDGGKAEFTVPDPKVDSAIYTITAKGTGYSTAEKSITVIKVYQITIVGPSGKTPKGEKVTVTITAKGSALAGASVTLKDADGNEVWDEPKISDNNGKISFTAPKKGEYTVVAEYEDYTTGEITITIGAEKDDGPGFELLTLIAAIGVAFILLRRRKKQK